MAKIIEASLLSFNIEKLQDEILDLKKNGINNVHYDVMDGIFVPNKAFGPEHLAILKKNNMSVSVHLMVSNPIWWILKFAKKPVKYLTFHPEPISKFQIKLCHFLLRLKGVGPGLAIKPKTDLNIYSKIIAKNKIVTIMGVEPGKGGQSFIEGTMENLIKAKQIKDTLNENLIIQIDGGVNFEVISKTIDYVDYYVSGSFLMKYQGPKSEVLDYVKNLE